MCQLERRSPTARAAWSSPAGGHSPEAVGTGVDLAKRATGGQQLLTLANPGSPVTDLSLRDRRWTSAGRTIELSGQLRSLAGLTTNRLARWLLRSSRIKSSVYLFRDHQAGPRAHEAAPSVPGLIHERSASSDPRATPTAADESESPPTMASKDFQSQWLS